MGVIQCNRRVDRWVSFSVIDEWIGGCHSV